MKQFNEIALPVLCGYGALMVAILLVLSVVALHLFIVKSQLQIRYLRQLVNPRRAADPAWNQPTTQLRTRIPTTDIHGHGGRPIGRF